MGHWNEDAGAEVFEHPCFVYGKVKIQTTSRVQEVCQNVENTAFPSSFSFFSFFKGINFFFLRFYLFLDRKGGRKRGRETSMCGCLSHAPPLWTWPTTRHVPCLGRKPATFWVTGHCSIYWVTPARAQVLFLWNSKYNGYIKCIC